MEIDEQKQSEDVQDNAGTETLHAPDMPSESVAHADVNAQPEHDVQEAQLDVNAQPEHGVQEAPADVKAQPEHGVQEARDTSASSGNKFNNFEKVYKINDNNNRYSHARNTGGNDRRSEFSKDRDLMRVNKFKKFDKIEVKKLVIDYKKPEILQEFLTEKGRILSRLITGNSAQNQRKLTREVKRARYIGFLPSA